MLPLIADVSLNSCKCPDAQLAKPKTPRVLSVRGGVWVLNWPCWSPGLLCLPSRHPLAARLGIPRGEVTRRKVNRGNARGEAPGTGY